MGLDIVAYKNLTKVEEPELDNIGCLINKRTEWRPGVSMILTDKFFKGRAEGLDADTVYTFEDYYRFCAGSHYRYGSWRRLLDEFKGEVAFQELINFFDDDGVIGPVVSKKLYDDFKKYEKEAEEFGQLSDDNGFFISNYRCWLEAFEHASDTGAVKFV